VGGPARPARRVPAVRSDQDAIEAATDTCKGPWRPRGVGRWTRNMAAGVRQLVILN